MKNVFLILLAPVILFSFFACSANNKESGESALTNPPSSENDNDLPSESPISEGTDNKEEPNFAEVAASYTPTASDLRPIDELTIEPVYIGAPTEFPASTELPEGVKSVKFEDWGKYYVNYLRDVTYDNKDGEELSLQVLLPQDEAAMMGMPSEAKYPLIVYVPGSAWMRQNVYMALPEMMRVCQKGYAVALVEYRGTDVAHFPATIEDAKTAIRFLKQNAKTYNIDPSKVAIWGNSSGGHTAVLAGITGDGLFDNGTYDDLSSEVQCIIDWYGPTDITLMNFYPSMMDHTEPTSPEGMFIGGLNVLENTEIAQETNPINYITADKEIPPILIMHGSRDILVPFNQSVRLYEKLIENNKDVEMYKLEDAGHGSGGFISDDALNIVIEFVSRQLGV